MPDQPTLAYQLDGRGLPRWPDQVLAARLHVWLTAQERADRDADDLLRQASEQQTNRTSAAGCDPEWAAGAAGGHLAVLDVLLGARSAHAAARAASVWQRSAAAGLPAARGWWGAWSADEPWDDARTHVASDETDGVTDDVTEDDRRDCG